MANFDFKVLNLLNFFGFSGFPEHPLVFNCHKFPCADDRFSLPIQRLLILARCHKCPGTDQQLSIPLPSLRTRRCVGDGISICVCATSFRHNPICRLEASSIPGLLDTIGLFTDEELVTELVRFIAVGLDFATVLFSSDCSCILFAILSVQLNKLKFFTQQRELEWLMLNKEDYSFVTCEVSLCQMSAVWCLVSTYLI